MNQKKNKWEESLKIVTIKILVVHLCWENKNKLAWNYPKNSGKQRKKVVIEIVLNNIKKSILKGVIFGLFVFFIFRKISRTDFPDLNIVQITIEAIFRFFNSKKENTIETMLFIIVPWRA